jgi:hypothetical protein
VNAGEAIPACRIAAAVCLLLAMNGEVSGVDRHDEPARKDRSQSADLEDG